MRFRVIVALSAVLSLFGCGSPVNVARLIEQRSTLVTQDLVDNWAFRMASDSVEADWIAATVPGTVHTDLMASGVIEDPFASVNESSLQWIEDQDWEYQLIFTASKDILDEQVQELVFKGLDTYADVYLNDSLVLVSDNMFLEWRVPVNGILRKGQNRLNIKFKNTYKTGLEALAKYPVKLPADKDRGEEKTSSFTRKAPYNFGWDWGPRLLTVGVWRPVSIEGWTTARIADVQIIQTSQSTEVATFDAHVRLATACTGSSVDIGIADSVGTVYAHRTIELENIGDTVVTLSFKIENPKLWWPNGTGDANLYPIYTIVAHKDNLEKLDQKVDRIGIRTVRLVQDKDSVGEGQSFYFMVNGRPIFAKGANYIPQDVFLPRVSVDKYTDFIAQCKQSNYNMLRVWGGGVYESDLFYDLCDKNGIMVWQDFIFACALYPWDEAFLENVRREAVYNVRRLRNHPSIVIWCGNNEIAEAWRHWGYQKSYGWSKEEQTQIWNGYKSLFEGVLPDVLSVEDTTRYYHSSSPMYGRGDRRSQTMGDCHSWGVFYDGEPFSTYKDKPGRFSNEYGFQSLACYDTYRQYLEPNEMVLYSDAMQLHQKNAKGYQVIEEYMAREFVVDKDDFRRYVYLSQLLQAEGLKIAMEGHRQKRPFTMGSLYWQVNDCWPAASWSSIDYAGRWKALQYYARRSFAPTALSFEQIDSTSQLKLWGVTDELVDKKGEVKLSLVDFDGKVLWRETLELNIAANSNQEIMFSTTAELLAGANPRRVVLVADAVVDGKELRALHYFVPIKRLVLPKADYTLELTAVEGTSRVLATIHANKLLKSVLVEADKLQGRASDAYFDLLAGEMRVVELTFEAPYSLSELGVFVTSL